MDGEGDLLSLRDEFSGESSLSISWSDAPPSFKCSSSRSSELWSLMNLILGDFVFLKEFLKDAWTCTFLEAALNILETCIFFKSPKFKRFFSSKYFRTSDWFDEIWLSDDYSFNGISSYLGLYRFDKLINSRTVSSLDISCSCEMELPSCSSSSSSSSSFGVSSIAFTCSSISGDMLSFRAVV